MLVKLRVPPELLVYWAFPISLIMAITGISYLRYAIYILPFFSMLIWFLSGNQRVHIFRELWGFILLFFLSIMSMVWWDFNTFKKLYFIFVFIAVFILFDFSRIEIDFRKLSIFFIIVGLINGTMRHVGIGSEEFSITESKSVFESTFAFPLGLLCLYFFQHRRFLWGLVSAIFVLVFLKRIVLVALVLCLSIWVLPRIVRRLILNPVVAVSGSLLIIWLSVQFALGDFDRFIFHYLNMSPNELSQGRQILWLSALRAADFDYQSFLFWGVGIGHIMSDLESALHAKKVLLHNDLLSLVLEIGLLFYLIFVYLFTALKRDAARIFAFFMLILFATDNVLIYQHVIFTYLFIQAQIRRESSISLPPYSFADKHAQHASLVRIS